MAISAPTLTKLEPLTQQVFSRGDSIPPWPDVLWRIEGGAVRSMTWSEEGTLITLGYWGSMTRVTVTRLLQQFETEGMQRAGFSAVSSLSARLSGGSAAPSLTLFSSK